MSFPCSSCLLLRDMWRIFPPPNSTHEESKTLLSVSGRSVIFQSLRCFSYLLTLIDAIFVIVNKHLELREGR